MVLIRKGTGVVIYIGTSNLTKKSTGRASHLESNVRVYAASDSKISGEVSDYFERLWVNEDGNYTLEYESYEDDSWFKWVLYRFQEFSGIQLV